MLAEGAQDSRIRGLARDVLAGRTELRAALLGGRYDDVLSEATSSFASWYRNLSDGEKAEHERRACDYFEELRQEVAEPPSSARPRRASTEDDWEPPASILRKNRLRR